MGNDAKTRRDRVFQRLAAYVSLAHTLPFYFEQCHLRGNHKFHRVPRNVSMNIYVPE